MQNKRHDRLEVRYAKHRLGPRKVGGTYYNGYWRKNVTVVSITWIEDDVWEITEVDERGTKRTHCTAWDYKRDRVVS